MDPGDPEGSWEVLQLTLVTVGKSVSFPSSALISSSSQKTTCVSPYLCASGGFMG